MFKFSDNIMEIISVLRGAGFQSLIAGGYIRNSLLGISVKDVDITTDATPEQVENLFTKTIPIGKEFGVVVVVMPDGEQFEIATFRADSEEGDGRRPEYVKFEKSPKADASRRDFTINAMFLDPLSGEILDFFWGKEDIKSMTIRFVGTPEKRIYEDKLRMLRAVRFASQLGFNIEPASLNAIKKHAISIQLVSAERQRDELIKILGSSIPSYGIRLLNETGLLMHVLPLVYELIGVEQPREFHPEGDVFEHTMHVIDNLAGEDPIVILAGLLHDIGKPKCAKYNEEKGRVQFKGHAEYGRHIAEAIMRELKFSNEEIHRVMYIVQMHMKMHDFHKMKLSKRRSMTEDPYFSDLCKVAVADSLSAGKDVSLMLESVEKSQSMPKVKTFISGRDLIELGFKPGPVFGEILQTVRTAQLEEEIHTKEEAIEIAKRFKDSE